MPTSSTAVHASAAAAVGVASFIPLPFVDDIVASLSRRGLVSAALRRHGRTFAAAELAPLYEGGSWLGLPFRIVKSLLLFPVKRMFRLVFVVFGARDVALAVGETLALGHTLERHLRAGHFANDGDAAARRAQAERLRAGLDAAFAGIDRRLVQRAVAALVKLRRTGVGDVAEVEGFFAEIDRRVDEVFFGRTRG